jgi:hypothetical protein
LYDLYDYGNSNQQISVFVTATEAEAAEALDAGNYCKNQRKR